MARPSIILPGFLQYGGLATPHEARGRVPSFVLPESFDPGEFPRTPKLRSRFDDARYFISLILRKLARWDVDRLGLVRLHAKHLKSIMYQADYAAVVEALVDGGAAERFPYQVGHRSFGYADPAGRARSVFAKRCLLRGGRCPLRKPNRNRSGNRGRSAPARREAPPQRTLASQKEHHAIDF